MTAIESAKLNWKLLVEGDQRIQKERELSLCQSVALGPRKTCVRKQTE